MSDLLILDEIHKMRDWKIFLKGVYDSKPVGQAILVTGSARLDTFRQSGESLAGRYFGMMLYPFSVKELSSGMTPVKALDLLNERGGFPEPLLSDSEKDALRWRNQYYSDLVREDILEFGKLDEIRAMRILVEMLRKRVGSTLSYSSLAGDLKIAPNTVRKYVDILESLHIVFLVRPFHSNIARAIQKEPKLYFYDTGIVDADIGRKLENTTAVCLKKHAAYLSDVEGIPVSLSYVRTKDGREVDFALVSGGRIDSLLEVKTSEADVSKSLHYFRQALPDVKCRQLVYNLRQEQTRGGIDILRLADWLAGLSA